MDCLPARPLAARQAAGGDGIAPVIVCLFDREHGTGTDSVVNYWQGTLCIPLSWNASGDQYLLVERFLCVLCIPLCSSGMKPLLGGLLRTKYFYAILNCFSLRENVTGFQLFLKWLEHTPATC